MKRLPEGANKPVGLVQYLCREYPFKNELEVPRVVKMVFLCDWLSAIVHGETLSDCRWKLGETGPLSLDLLNALKQARGVSLSFDVMHTPLGERRERLEPMGETVPVDPQAAEVMTRVCAMVSPMAWNDLMRCVYQLSVVLKTPPRGDIDLVGGGSDLRADRSKLKEEIESFRPSRAPRG